MQYSKFTSKVLGYIKEQYAAEPEFLWENDSNNAAIRNPDNRKWFAVLMMNMPRKTLRLDGGGTVDIMDLKCDPLLLGSLLDGRGCLPAYHMNKEHWLTVLLDGTVPAEDIFAMIDISYALVSKGKRRKTK